MLSHKGFIANPVFVLFSVPFLFFLIILFRHYCDIPTYINMDVAEALYAAEKMAMGKQLYIDWMEINPPPIYLLHTVNVFIGRILNLPPVSIFYSMIVAFLALALSIIFSTPQKHSRDRTHLIAAYLLFALVISPLGYEGFAQREYIFTLGLLAYVPARIFRRRPNITSLIFYLLFGFTMGLKPQFIAIVVAVELYFLSQKNDLAKNELLSVIGGLFLPYAVFGALYYPSLAHYIQTFGDNYLLYDLGDTPASFQDVLYKLARDKWMLLLVGVFTLVFLRDYTKEKSPVAIPFLILFVMTWISTASQNRYWGYHWIPLFGVCLLFITYKILHWSVWPENRITYSFSTIAVAVAILQYCLFVHTLPRYAYESLRFRPLLSKDDKLLPLSYSCALVAGSQYSKIPMAGNWAHYFTLNQLAKQSAVDRHSNIKLKTLLDGITGAIAVEKPKLIVIDTKRRGNERPLAQVIYKDLQILPIANYRKLEATELAQCCSGPGSFDVWIRND